MLAHASTEDCQTELAIIINSIEEGVFDHLVSIGLLVRMQKLFMGKAQMVKALSLPQHLLYLLFPRPESASESALEKPRKYAILQLLDSIFSSEEVARNYIMDFTVVVKSMHISTVELLFRLADAKETNALGIALILLLLNMSTCQCREWWR